MIVNIGTVVISNITIFYQLHAYISTYKYYITYNIYIYIATFKSVAVSFKSNTLLTR